MVDQDFERQLHSAAQPLPSDSIFATLADRVQNHADEVLAARSGPQPVPYVLRRLLADLRSRVGAKHVIDTGILAARLGVNERRCREHVQELRHKYGVMIGASHDSSISGYYLIATEEEARATIEPMKANAIAQLRVVMKMSNLDPQQMAIVVERGLRKEID